MGSKGTFDTPCKLNFRVGPGEEDGDKGTRRRTREAAGMAKGETSRIAGVSPRANIAAALGRKTGEERNATKVEKGFDETTRTMYPA